MMIFPDFYLSMRVCFTNSKTQQKQLERKGKGFVFDVLDFKSMELNGSEILVLLSGCYGAYGTMQSISRLKLILEFL